MSIDRTILEYCKTPKKYSEIIKHCKNLQFNESTIKYHITSCIKKEWIIKKSEGYEINPYASDLNGNITYQVKVGKITNTTLRKNFNDCIKTSLSSKTLDLSYISRQINDDIGDKILALISTTVIGNPEIYPHIKSPEDYNFSIRIDFSSPNKETFMALQKYGISEVQTYLNKKKEVLDSEK